MIKKQIIFGIIVAIILGIGYYTISPLFIHTRVDDVVPQAAQASAGIKINSGIDVRSEKSISVTGTSGHPASGTVKIVRIDGKTYLRYENFKTINGPDIYVYLAKNLDAKEYVSLGKVRATEGNINYEIPSNVNIADYPYALTWCKTFGVLFNSAKLN